MTRRHSARGVFLSSLVSLLLCFSMLLGTTYAWFTDSVTSANNIIQSGTLDVSMEWADGTKNVPAADSTDWIDASSGPIFNSVLWEPGYAEVRHIKIENEGTLALKYKVSIVANGEVSDLSDVIDVYYVDPAVQVADRDALTADKRLGTLTEVLAALGETGYGELLAGEKDTITLALVMQDEAGDEYQGKSLGTTFAIQLVATQLSAEPDSFGKDYDNAADFPIVSVPVARPTTGGANLAASSDSVGISIPQEVVDALPAGVTEIGIAHTVPKYDTESKAVVFDSVEIVDQDGNVIDLSELDFEEKITVTLPAQTMFAEGETVVLYHDGVAVTSTVVGANGVISYEVEHLCEVTVAYAQKLISTEYELSAAFATGGRYMLGADIKLVNGLYTEDGDSFSLDLNGHTITITGEKANLFTVAGAGNLTIYNGKLVAESTNHMLNGTGTSTGASKLVYFYSYGNLTMTDVDIEGSCRGGHRAVEVYYGNANLSGLNINTAYGTGVSAGDSAKVVLDDCNITVNGMYSAPYNSVCFSVMYGAEMTIKSGNYTLINDNTYDTGATHGGWVGIVMNSGGSITTLGGTYTNVPAEGFVPAYERAIIEGENVSPSVATINLIGGTFKPQASKVYSGYGIGDSPRYPVFNGKLTDNGDGTWTASPDVVVNDEAELLAAIAAGESYILLGADVELSKTLEIKGITIDGNGHKITMSDFNNYHTLIYATSGNNTIRNVTFDGIKKGAAVRTLDCDMVIENCIFTNCENTENEGIVRINYGSAILRGCSFVDNVCTQVLTYNFDVDDPVKVEEEYLLVEDCVFERNECSSIGVLYYACGHNCNLRNNVFKDNTISATANGATVYLGFTENNSVTGNVFENNSFVTTDTTTRVSGGIFFGYDAEFVNNSFVGNTAENGNGDAVGNNVCVSTYYTDIDLSGNYWGGNAPVEGDDYFVQHKSDERKVIVKDFLTEYAE